MGPSGAHRQHRHVVIAVPRRALLLALAVLTPALAVGCGGRPADAVTTLRTGGPGVQVVAADGRVSPAVDGERLSVGVSVRTAGSTAALLTGGRVTTLAPRSEVVIAGRSRYLLDDGTVVLDHRAGPGATVVAGPVSIGNLGRTSVRVERGFAVRVAVYDGGNAQVTADGTTLTVLALHEADVPGSVLPTVAPPLSLRDDALDAAAAPALVSLDRALLRRAAQIDGPTGAQAAGRFARRTTTVVPASDVSTGPLADRVLPAAMAGAVGGDVSRTYAVAAALRAAGGSWGVVAELVGAHLAGIQREVALLLAPVVAGSPLTGVLAGTGPITVLNADTAGLPGGVIDGLVGSGTAGGSVDGVTGGSGGTRGDTGAGAGGAGSGSGDGSGTGTGGTGTTTGTGGSGGDGGTSGTATSAPDPGTSADPQPTPSTVDAGGGVTPAPTTSAPATSPTASASTLVGGLVGTVLGLVAPSATPPVVVVLPKVSVSIPRL